MPVDIDDIYRTLPLERIPWNIETPPQALVDLVESGRIKPCKAVDLGCGAGNYAIYLAGKGFDVTGVDISPTAIRIAKENALKKGGTLQVRRGRPSRGSTGNTGYLRFCLRLGSATPRFSE